MNGSLKRKLEAVFRDLSAEHEPGGRLTVHAGPASTPSVLKLLKDDGYDYLVLVSCVDWPDDEELEVVYIVSRYPASADAPAANEDETPTPGNGMAEGSPTQVVLKIRVPRESPTLETAIGIYPVAEPYEREIHELFGVHFEGHPRLTPLFLERDYEIPPFRKDFDTRDYVEKVFGSVPPVGEETPTL